MEIYFAPLEGLTDAFFRKTHHAFYPGLNGYYTPFFSPTVHRSLTAKEERELPPFGENGLTVIPQMLTKNPEDFLWMANTCADLGYPEINLNTGCPSGTVFAKGKGSGMLSDLHSLDRFLDAVCGKSPIPISVKTRIGILSPDEFPAILDVFNQYPISCLTVHPRVRKAFYNGKPDMDAFQFAVENSKNPLCYNGDLKTLSDIDAFRDRFPTVAKIMIGRALIGDPGLLCGNTDLKTLREFEDTLFDGYLSRMGSARNTMFRMKEHWSFLLPNFEGSEKLAKKLRKTTDVAEYKNIISEIFQTCSFKPGR